MATSALMLGTLALGGCIGSQQQDNVEATAQQGQQMVNLLPGLVRAFGEESVSLLSETSCTSSPDPETASRNTRWTGAVGFSASSAQEGRGRAQAVREYAESTGWASEDRAAVHPSGERLYTATRGDLTLVLEQDGGEDEPGVSFTVTSPCLEKPDGHTMTRSELDSMYGSSDPLYPNDDRSKFTNGEPKPLPGSPDNSPSEGN
ncbi:hypothetical protein [Citricoccus nitrophenolicus]|uniref:hypothetical protein n=1 Tax=Citricoccus nitrophenolicus TaxID=863575 RepID=UPI0031F16F2A